ncbi:MAG: HD domain-containing protein [Armatimonadetes bacterium]|nr:HD domain-containing protein [Armatimonadota bacterium]
MSAPPASSAPETETCPLFSPDLDKLDTPDAIAAYLKGWHRRINGPEAIQHGGTGAILEAHNTALVDAVLRRLFALAVAHASPADTAPALAIIATGGYGRRELAPFSDVDLTFVPAHEDDDFLNIIIKDMFQMVMDVFLYGAGHKVGYAYRLIGDLGQLDHQTQTALLDARFLCGDRALFREFRSAFRAQLLTADFLFQKWAERQNVLARHGGDEVYSVEPNVKESAGGLRDIQNAEWVGEARARVGLSRVWPALTDMGALSDEEAAQIRLARAFLHTVRCALHIVSGEARDTLTAEKQEAVAALLAYSETPDVPAVETFMRDYFTHAARARRIARKVIAHCLDSELTLTPALASVGRRLVVTDAAAAARDAALPLHAAELAQAYYLDTRGPLEDEIRRFLEACPAPADSAYAGRVFARLLTQSRSVADTLDRLEEWGALAWLLPEFGPLMVLIPYDAAHEYTVGAHSLRVVRNLESLKTTADPRLTDYKRIVAEISFPEVLYLAGLIHDVGKQWPQGRHEETGAEAARRIAERLGWDRERHDKLAFLVRHHLLMAETSRLRDLSLDETLREFTRQIPDLDCLNMLYLLTYADTNAVGAGVWTEVKAKFLSELYYRAEAVLASPAPLEAGETVPPPHNLARQRDRIKKQLAAQNLPPDLIHEHTRNLPAQYLLNTPLEEMYLHIAMIGRLRETFQPIVDFRHEYGADFTEMTLAAFDDPRPGLLAKITGVLYAHDINVHSAQVFTRASSVRIALDTLWVDYRGRPLTPGKRDEVSASLRRVLLGEIGVGALLQKHKKPLKEQAIFSAIIDDASSERFSLLEISAPDEKGVVYRLARAVAHCGWNIHAARLSVWGSRARDAFYITDLDGKKVPADAAQCLTSFLPAATSARRKR